MALRILFLILAAIIAINIVLLCVGMITNVNLYEKYGKQILISCCAFAIFIIIAYTIIALLGLI